MVWYGMNYGMNGRAIPWYGIVWYEWYGYTMVWYCIGMVWYDSIPMVWYDFTSMNL